MLESKDMAQKEEENYDDVFKKESKSFEEKIEFLKKDLWLIYI